MRTRRPAAIALAVAATLLMALAPTAIFAATTGVQCGIINAYTAPDSIAPTDGSIQFGFSGPTETVLADATVDPAVVTNLPNQTGNGAITCLSVTADGSGDITALAYAASGQISGLVTYDSGQDAYIIADSIFVPASELVSQPELQAVIGVPYSAGQPLTVTLTIDTSSGNPTAISTASSVSGPVSINGGGDVLIDGATLPAAFVTGNAAGALQVAEATGADADVDIDGAIDTSNGNFVISLGVDTIGCTTVESRSATSISLDGVFFDLAPGATAAASLTTGVEAGVRIVVAPNGDVAITEVTVPGCGSIAPIDPPATDTDATGAAGSEPLGIFTMFSYGAFAMGLLVAWYAAAVAIRRRTAKPDLHR